MSTSLDRFVTDLGHSPVLVPDAGEPIVLGRYGVWLRAAHGRKHQVVETGDDLELLMAKHGIPASRVLRIAPSKNSSVEILPGNYTLQIDGVLVGNFDTLEALEESESTTHRPSTAQVIVYGPDGIIS